VEIQQHSIHYIDLVRSFLGEPRGVYAKTVKHPKQMNLASTRTSIIFDYGNAKQVLVATNHDHEFGPQNQESYIKWEGTRGAIKARMGLLMNYPQGAADLFEYCLLRENEPPRWRSDTLEGSWFPDAFAGTMANLQRFAMGEDKRLFTGVEDVANTMRVVEACHHSSESGETVIPTDD
jgi:predicted dehydrogenase